ncbi:hypothetical protein BH24ACT23_BH24ACT23_04140 [soil metagenome]
MDSVGDMEGNPDPQAGGPAPGQGEQPSEEELRAHLEEQLRQVRVQDLIIESAASIVNLTVRRIAKPDEQDLEQAKIGIEAVRSLVDLVEGDVAGQIRTALSELQMLYARAAKGEPLDGGEQGGETAQQPAEGQPQTPPQPPSQAPPGQEPPPKLWTPGRG